MTLSASPSKKVSPDFRSAIKPTLNPLLKRTALKDKIQHIENSQHALIGKTVNPQAAVKTLNVINYDGTGTILKFKTRLSPDHINTLQENLIPALKDTPVRVEEKRILTPGECLINIITLIRNSNLREEEKVTIVGQAKAIFLAGNISESLEKFYKSLIRKEAANDETLRNKLGELFSSVENGMYATKRYDNFFGRIFESRLAEIIVANPTSEMLKVTQLVLEKIITDFNAQGFFTQRKICSVLSYTLKYDCATWHPSIPEVAAFTNRPSPKTLLALLNSEHPLKPILAMYMAVKYINTPGGLRGIRQQTFLSYSDIIQPQRYWYDRFNSSQKQSNRTGIQLTWQMKGQNHPQNVKGVRPLDKTHPDIFYVSSHDMHAFRQEKPIAVGMSGSANLLDFLFDRLQKVHPDLNRDHARLLATAFLVYSGGHSVNEVWTVINNFNFEPLPYNKIVPNDSYMVAAIDDAWESMIAEAAMLYTQKTDASFKPIP